MSARGPDSERKRSRTKIDRVVERYGLRRIPEQLRDLWLGTGDEQRSTRELADWFNRQVLGAAIADLPAVTISGDVDQIYTQLQGEDSADRRLIRDRLMQRGVDIDEVEANFISHQTVYRYLTEELGVQQPTPSPEEQAERANECGRTPERGDTHLDGPGPDRPFQRHHRCPGHLRAVRPVVRPAHAHRDRRMRLSHAR